MTEKSEDDIIDIIKEYLRSHLRIQTNITREDYSKYIVTRIYLGETLVDVCETCIG